MKKNLFYVFLISLFFFACNGNEEIKKTLETGDYYVPSKPVSVTELLPSWGQIDQDFIVRGNFPKDTAQIKVYFGTRRAVILGCDGYELYGMIPKQSPGYNQLSVVVGKDSITPDIQFKYYQTQSLKTIVGKFGDDQYLEGSLDEARIKNPTGLGTVEGKKGDNIILVEGEWDSRISLISLDDNKMIKIADVGWSGGPAVTSTRDKFYVINRSGNRNIYSFSKNNGWTTTPVTDLTITDDMLSSGSVVGGLSFAEDDRLLYVMTGDGYLGCIDLVDKTFTKVLGKNDWDGVNIGTDWSSYLMYSKYYKCFFATFQGANGIFKITQDAEKKWKAEKFAGFNSGNNVILGHRLNDAVLRNPAGVAVNQDGEIYFASRSGHVILKIKGDIVSLVAGTPGSYGAVTGAPLESRFDQPRAIVTDFEDNFYIGDGSNRVIRKLTIE
ncbi:hypothetical protein [uncultured Bacteroides sp.]|uniref:hypothetical protein n=1 Tax=uncultured Bacteroides sp. TaxID=162156 RepID=UPI002AAB225C|nr:hypothetical protein [uncultured Bacteroides sp.]